MEEGCGWEWGQVEAESSRIKESIQETETSYRWSFPSLKKPSHEALWGQTGGLPMSEMGSVRCFWVKRDPSLSVGNPGQLPDLSHCTSYAILRM